MIIFAVLTFKVIKYVGLINKKKHYFIRNINKRNQIFSYTDRHTMNISRNASITFVLCVILFQLFITSMSDL